MADIYLKKTQIEEHIKVGINWGAYDILYLLK